MPGSPTIVDLPPNHDRDNLLSFLRLLEATKWDMRRALDIGAHKGHWTRELAGWFNEVIAFEPVWPNFKELVRLSAMDSRIVPKQKAVGDEGLAGREVRLLPGPENTGQWHLASPAETIDGASFRAKATTIDREIAPYLPVDLVKLDIEGYEYFAINAARRLIMRQAPAFIIEENGLEARYGLSPFSASRLLEELGYEQALRCNKDYLFLPKGGRPFQRP